VPRVSSLCSAVAGTVAGLPRQFWWLWTGTLVNRAGAFVLPFLAIYLTDSLDYSTAFAGLVLGAVGLGAAVDQSGLGTAVASVIVGLMMPLGAIGALAAILVATMLLTELISNNAAAVLAFPVAVATAAATGSAVTTVSMAPDPTSARSRSRSSRPESVNPRLRALRPRRRSGTTTAGGRRRSRGQARGSRRRSRRRSGRA